MDNVTVSIRRAAHWVCLNSWFYFPKNWLLYELKMLAVFLCVCEQAKPDGKETIVVRLINKSINAYLDARSVALTIWKLALAFVNVIGLDQIVLKVSVLTSEASILSHSPVPSSISSREREKKKCSTFNGICLSRNHRHCRFHRHCRKREWIKKFQA